MIRTVQTRRRGERPPLPATLVELDRQLRSPQYLHLGRGLEAPYSQLYRGLVGRPGAQAAIFLFPEVVEWLPVTAEIFIDGTMKVTRFMIQEVCQIVSLVTSWMDHVSCPQT